MRLPIVGRWLETTYFVSQREQRHLQRNRAQKNRLVSYRDVEVVALFASRQTPLNGLDPKVEADQREDKALEVLNGYEERKPVIEGCEYREALQAVRIEGGVAGNVVPDKATLTFNHRVAPDRDLEEAESFIRNIFSSMLTSDDELKLVDSAPPAKPGLSNPMLASMIGKHDLQVRAKLGWTDVAFFDQRGIPAANFGPGDATLAHTQEERITKPAVDSCYLVLKSLIENGL